MQRVKREQADAALCVIGLEERTAHYGILFRGMDRIDAELDVQGLDCPMPLLKAKRALNGMEGGERLRVVATDPGSARDFEAFARLSGNPLIESHSTAGVYTFVLQKKAE